VGSRLAVAAGVLACSLGCAAVATRPEVARAAAPLPDAAARQILVTFAPQPSLGLPRAGSSAPDYDGGADYKTTMRTRELAEQIGRSYGLTVVSQWPVEALHVHCVVFAVGAEAARSEVIARLAKDPRIESVQPMQLFAAEGRASTDYRDLQHNLAELGLADAQRWATGAGVRVAIVDTGVDLSHPALAGRIAQARDFVADSPRRPPAERHGTAVAGVIAADTGIVGVAPGAELLALRACWPVSPDAAEASCSSFTLAKALSFAIAAHPQVINLSLGGPADPLLERLVRVALTKGIVVVAARGATADTRFPSDVPGVVAVLAWPPPQGAPGDDGASALAAPGKEILTAVPGGHYDFLSGSSLAAGEVSGVIALLLEGRKVRPEDVPRLLHETSQQPTSAGATAARRVDACSALARVRRGPSCS
jgi:hypothetical protein